MMSHEAPVSIRTRQTSVLAINARTSKGMAEFKDPPGSSDSWNAKGGLPLILELEGASNLMLMSSSNFLFMLPMEKFIVPLLMMLAEGKCSQVHE